MRKVTFTCYMDIKIQYKIKIKDKFIYKKDYLKYIF